MAKGHAIAEGTGHSEHVHHLSPAPIIIGIGALFGYIGLASGLGALAHGTLTAGGVSLLAGVVIFAGGVVMWIREDVGMWRDRYVDHGVLPGRDLGWWGMAFFLGTEVVLFGGLFAAFFVTRSNNQDVWTTAREHLSHAIPLVTVNTAILVSSGFTMHFLALHGIRENKRSKFLLGMVVTIALGATFLVIQMSEYAKLISGGVVLNAGEVGQFGSVFYILTGTHAFHVFLGLVFLTIVLVRGLLGQFDAARHVAVDTFAIYWHFVDVVWILLYLIVYVGVA